MRSARGNGNRDSARLTPALLVAVSVTFAVRFPISFPLALYVVAVRRFTFGAYPGSGPLGVGSRGLSWVGSPGRVPCLLGPTTGLLCRPPRLRPQPVLYPVL